MLGDPDSDDPRVDDPRRRRPAISAGDVGAVIGAVIGALIGALIGAVTVASWREAAP